MEPINLRTDVIFGTTTPKEVEIVDETSDQFLVIASVEYIDVTLSLIHIFATRYAKTTTSFLAAVQIRCIAIWCAVLA